MKITAQLALSQMKVNKKRTIAGIFAIALATSLITTVMCFVTRTIICCRFQSTLILSCLAYAFGMLQGGLFMCNRGGYEMRWDKKSILLMPLACCKAGCLCVTGVAIKCGGIKNPSCLCLWHVARWIFLLCAC